MPMRYSVTQRIKAISQPHGGYLPIKEFTRTPLGNAEQLNPKENIHPALVGLTVDYLTRMMLVETPPEAFHIPLLGAKILGKEVEELPTDLSSDSIRLAVDLASYDVAVRATPERYTPTNRPDEDTIENIRILTNRVIKYHTENPIVWPGFTFEGGYTHLVVAGDGDWLTKDGLYDLKVLRSEPNSQHTLQILMYWIMGMNSIHGIYEDMRYLALINPRKDVVYTLDLEKVSKGTIEQVKRDVLVVR